MPLMENQVAFVAVVVVWLWLNDIDIVMQELTFAHQLSRLKQAKRALFVSSLYITKLL